MEHGIDFKKVFSQLSHIKALSQNQKFDQVVQNLIIHAMVQTDHLHVKNEKEIVKLILDHFGILIRENLIQSNVSKLIDESILKRDVKEHTFSIIEKTATEIRTKVQHAHDLENEIKAKWIDQVSPIISVKFDGWEETIWRCLSCYLCHAFEQHGILTTRLLHPATKLTDEQQQSLNSILSRCLDENGNPFQESWMAKVINGFILNADEQRTQYISQLVDATFTSYALTQDQEAIKYLNNRLNNILLFLDTNFIFGVLNLHRNSEDSAAKQILSEISKFKLPFKLVYHPETIAEFKRALDSRSLVLKASKWDRITSQTALEIEDLYPIERLYHQQNSVNEIDPVVFLEKYDHVEEILKDLGFNEYPIQPFDASKHFEIEEEIERYKDFVEKNPLRKPKTFSKLKHDIVVLDQVRTLNQRKTKFLDASAIFLSADFILAKYEKKYLMRKWETYFVLNPSIFLQLIRPFVEEDYESNKNFIETFSITEFRSFDIDYSSTKSTALQIINDEFHGASTETKIKILRDQILLGKLQAENQNYEAQKKIIENEIASENKRLVEEQVAKDALTKELKSKIETTDGKIDSITKIYSETLSQKDIELSDLKDQLQNVKAEIEREKALRIYDKLIEEWNRLLEQYQKDTWEKFIKDVKKGFRILLNSTIIIGVPVTGTIVLGFFRQKINDQLNSTFWTISLVSFIGLLSVGAIIYRTVIMDKELIKLWWEYFKLIFSKAKLKRFKEEYFAHQKVNFEEQNALPKKPE